MKYIIISILSLSTFLISCHGQSPKVRPSCSDKDFDTSVSKWLSFTVPLKGVKELSNNTKDYLILDAREKKEYTTSHIEGALHIGYDKFEFSSLEQIDKDQKLIVYCSIGYRSEKIGEKLQKAGFTNVYNLYGSIFEWVNQGLPLVDVNNQKTNKIHTYNKRWSKWVLNEEYQKVW